jgi:predicted kinase
MMLSYFEWRKNKMEEKICYIMRGLPGSGKSTKVKELLNKHAASVHGHVFSSDRYFHPEASKLDQLDINSLDSDEKLIEAASAVLKLWYDCNFSKKKKETELAFLDFKKLFDKGQYKEALELAKNLTSELEAIEYQSKWQAHLVPPSHLKMNNLFKEAIDKGISPVISDNTNVALRDMKTCVEYANKAGYNVQFIEPDSEHWKAHRSMLSDKYKNRDALEKFATLLSEKNTHGVPKATLEKMIAKWVNIRSVDDVLNPKV